MSTAPFPGSFVSPLRSNTASPGDLPMLRPVTVRRRGNPQQGHALETLGHAIEYLTDTRMFSIGDTAERARAEAEAVQIMMRASRAVFEECAEFVPLHTRIARRLQAAMPEWMRFLD
ncbi:hypothetical protein SAMN05421770_103514 [Granulicella rosea]|uniref:Uncharacterized protein n=1 Tax=Granulicella rosea TaxID=474952 RepID=A0A239JA90_9BACT|nr:hypothetical protein [Granulicella rosea]SNT02760.1 hypothetical protein SAMN05421770_103514 [Granulicella rosea]